MTEIQERATEFFENAYDAMGELYDLLSFLSPHGNVPTLDAAWFIQRAKSLGAEVVVELGIGTGRVGIPMAEAGFRVFGIDSSVEMERVTNERATAAGVADRMHVLNTDFGAWTLPDGQQPDLVYCPYHSFSHVLSAADRLRILGHCAEQLRVGGQIVLNLDAGDGADTETELEFTLDNGDELKVAYRQEWNPFDRLSATTVAGRRVVAATGEVQRREFKIILDHLDPTEMRSIAIQLGLEVTVETPWPDECPNDRMWTFTKVVDH